MIGDRFSWRDEFFASLGEGLKLVSVFSLGDLFPSSPLVRNVAYGERTPTTGRTLSSWKYGMHHHHSIKQHEERRAAALANSTDQEEEDLEDVLFFFCKPEDVLLRVQN